MVRRKSHGDTNIPIDMTPMIDIVFQLLTFFVMTFKIASAEGDFNIKMPGRQTPGQPTPDALPPFKVTIKAGAGGNHAEIRLNDRTFANWKDLHAHVIDLVGTGRGPGSRQPPAEVELDCDYNLQYENVVAAITAVSGDVSSDGTLIRLVEKIKFSPPKQPH